MFEYLVATSRSDIASLAEELKDHLKADDEVAENTEQYYDEVIEINLSAGAARSSKCESRPCQIFKFILAILIFAIVIFVILIFVILNAEFQNVK